MAPLDVTIDMMTECISQFFTFIGYVDERDFTYNKSVFDFNNHYHNRLFNVTKDQKQKLHIHSSSSGTYAEAWIDDEAKVTIPNIRALLEFLSIRFDPTRQYKIEDISPSSFKKMRAMLEEFVAFMTASRDGCSIQNEFVIDDKNETMLFKLTVAVSAYKQTAEIFLQCDKNNIWTFDGRQFGSNAVKYFHEFEFESRFHQLHPLITDAIKRLNDHTFTIPEISTRFRTPPRVGGRINYSMFGVDITYISDSKDILDIRLSVSHTPRVLLATVTQPNGSYKQFRDIDSCMQFVMKLIPIHTLHATDEQFGLWIAINKLTSILNQLQ